jgi:hypothetical protein
MISIAAAGCSSSGDPHKRVFVTRATFAGNFGGLVGADAQCNSFAVAAGLRGTWRAWLSDSATNALDRMADVGPWVDMKGNRVFRDKAQMMGFPDIGVAFNETQGMIASTVWTGTVLGGSKATSHCGDWTGGGDRQGITGNAITPDSWTDAGPRSCTDSHSLLCFEE